MSKDSSIEKAYQLAKMVYEHLGVDADNAMNRLETIPLSLQCWQGDDVGGFEKPDAALGDGGIQVTGNYPGKARNIDELRHDLDKAFSLIPGTHRVNLHASYLDNQGRFVDRNEIEPSHFNSWIDWAKERHLGMDFNATFFSHPNAKNGFTLAHPDDGIRHFWIEHGIACRKISEQMGKRLGSPCITNFWIPDGSKDTPADRLAPRQRLRHSLDTIFAETFDPRYHLDSVEGKLFGIGSESYVVGSHDFYLAYALTRNKLICLDTGHFHPTECIADKISSILTFMDQVLLHVSRGVRWDSDHVVILSDPLDLIMEEVVWNDYLNRIHIGMDFFDATINRVAAWVIGARSVLKSLLKALLSPITQMRELENAGDYTARLAMREQLKTLPYGAVWDYYCLKMNVPEESEWIRKIRKYEAEVASKR